MEEPAQGGPGFCSNAYQVSTRVCCLCVCACCSYAHACARTDHEHTSVCRQEQGAYSCGPVPPFSCWLQPCSWPRAFLLCDPGFVLASEPAGPLLRSHTVVTDPWPPIQLPQGPGASVCPPSPRVETWGRASCLVLWPCPVKAQGMGNSCAGRFQLRMDLV